MRLDPSQRAALARAVLDELRRTAPGSQAVLRGSLAQGRADPYSDIDALWDVPDEDFVRCVDAAPAVLARVRPVESVRSDPLLQRSRKRRLLFVRFRDAPLFWRLDLDVFARSAGRDPAYDLDNPHARGTQWSSAESALANAVAAVKAHLRHNDTDADALLTRAYQRVGVPPPDVALRDLVLALVDAVTAMDATAAGLGQRIRRLVGDAFPEAPSERRRAREEEQLT